MIWRPKGSGGLLEEVFPKRLQCRVHFQPWASLTVDKLGCQQALEVPNHTMTLAYEITMWD
jgi:hypothetical protein